MYRMKESYEFSDLNSDGTSNSRTRLTEDTPTGKGGCHVSTATGFVLALLAILIAVGVGVIVHFASPAKTLECHCNYPGAGQNTPSPEAQWQSCVQMAKDKDHCLVPDCPGGSPPPTTATTLATTTTEPPKEVPYMRLPTALVPVHYVVEIEPRMYTGPADGFTFRGSVDILIECKTATNNITLHLNTLEIVNSSIVLTGAGGASTPGIVNYELDTVREFIVFNLDGDLSVGSQYNIKMDFSGPLKDDLRGLYLSSYQQDNQTVYLATTQFQVRDARKTFPCFDEPAIKATFDITLVRRNDYNARSNMPIVRSEARGSDMTADVFNTTAKMSTYLLAFLVSKFEGKHTMTQRGVQVGVWSRPEALVQADYSLQVAVDILEYFETYYGINYPFSKLDNAAVPDFAFGAMENWGLIIYRETAMLFDPDVSTSGDKSFVALVVTHEIAHQWFGNLVTPAWWDDLWLNEGFASYMESVGRDHIHPEWKVFEMFLTDQLQNAFNLDGLKSSHPIYVPVNHPDEINQIFDSISYNKGAAILRMLQHYLGEAAFKRGITRYLEQNAFSAAHHNELWKALDAESGPSDLTVKEIMDTWILQMNYPVVTVTRARDHAFTISQSRFLLNSDAEENPKYPSPYDYKWNIPFTFTTSQDTNFSKTRTRLLRTDASQVEISDTSLVPEWNPSTWVIGNVRQAGFYRVNYDEGNWQALINQLNEDHAVISTENRAQLINDAWNLAKAGLVDPKYALQTVDYLEDEESYVPWKAAHSELTFVKRMLTRTPEYGDFQSYMAKLIKKQYDRIGWEERGGDLQDSLFQTLILERACDSGVTECVTEAKRLYAEWMTDEDTNPIPVELKEVVYCTAIAYGGQAEWDFGYKIYQTTNVGSERQLLQAALACSTETWILSRYLSRCLDVNEVRKQDAMTAVGSIASNPVGRGLAWDFVRQHWEELMERYGGGISRLSRLVSRLAQSFNTEFDLEQLRDFMEKYPDMGATEGAFRQAVETIQTNIKWQNKMDGVIGDWLKDKETPEKKITDVRLPTSLKPLVYTVEIKPDFYGVDPENFFIEGHVSIRMKCEKAADNITLHVNKLDIDQSSIKVWTGASSPDAGTEVLFDTPYEDKDRQFFILPLRRNLTAGEEYYVSMSYKGPLKGDLAGLYLSQYKRGDQTVYMATTQFQPTDARKAFPCFDEPAIKAQFNIILLRKPHLISLSNMPILRTENRSDGFVADVYNTTVKMSTYLLAFIVCDFTYKEQITATGIRFRVYARPEAINQADYSLDIGVKILEYFETYFDIPFPLPKLDMIAIPDFSAGAMENWGLITYRETAMLYDPLVSAESNKERVAIVVSHELAHSWFGNLVTPSWWDDLWLNEGFATFVEYIGVDHVHKDWRMHDIYVKNEVQRSFGLDGLVTSHPLYVTVAHPDEINAIFDSISYAKGAAVINMIKTFLGESTFLKGLQNYLKERSYDAAFHEDLWDALSRQSAVDGSNIDVKSVMDTWILQMNYPVITFNRSGDSVTVSQQRYLQDRSAQDPGKYPSPFGYMWEVPLTFTSNLEKNFTNNRVYWLGRNQTSVTIPADPSVLPPVSDKSSWVIGNLRQNCYYRVNYDSENWAALISQLKRDHTMIEPVNRAQIISDSWSLAGSGLLDQLTALRAIEYLAEEEDYVPFSVALSELDYVRYMLAKTGTFGVFRDYLKTMITPLYTKTGWDNTNATHLESYMRNAILSVACENGHEGCIMEAKKLFSDWMKDENNNPVDPNFKSNVYCTAIEHGGIEEWDFAYKMYKQTNVATEAVRLLFGMSCSTEPWILTRYLLRTLSSEEIRRQDADSCITYVSYNPIGQSIAWDFVREKWEDIIGTDSFSSARLVRGVTARFNTEFQLNQLEEFMAKYPNQGSASAAFQQALEKIRTGIDWLKKNEKIIADWLMEQGNNEETATDVRLPLDVYPMHYDLELKPDIYGPDPKAFTFEGSVKIRLNCRQSTNNVTLHVNKLEYAPIAFRGLDGCVTPDILDVREDKQRQFLIVSFNDQLVPGCNYSLETNFTGPLKDDLAGLYLSSYQKGNETVYIATSQLQPVDARKTFPCFDEPAIKSTFAVTLLRKSHMKSLSNMMITSTENRADDYMADVYGTTPKMSTYLLAFIVCDFAHKENTTRGGTLYRVWARADAIDQADYALDVGVRILEYFEGYFEIPYPLPKQDMIAIPDFGAGAMENWGLITYRETAMLYDPNVSAESNKQRVATVVSHELAHQWFGNLVTPSWWDDIWLNEGFASYVEYIGVDVVEPTWKMFEQFVTLDLQDVFNFDSLTSSHPVYVPVNHPDEINEIFDRISYSKGASIIRMMRYFLGDETFRKGLTKYLRRLAYDAAFHDDLWQALTEQSQEDAAVGGSEAWDVKTMMDTWTLQMNYPVVTLNRTGQPGGSVKVSQSRFLWDYTAPEDPRYPSPFHYRWNVPLTIVSSLSPDFTTRTIYRINRTEDDRVISDNTLIPPSASNHWIIGNAKQFGYYRVNYDMENWRNLIAQLNTNHMVIDPINRAQIINDAWNLAKAGLLDLTVALDTLGYIGNEESYVPWVAASRELSDVDLRLSKTSSYGIFSAFTKQLSATAASKISWDISGDHLQAYIRGIVFGKACDYGVEDCVNNATSLYREWMNDPTGKMVHPDLKSFVYCTAIREGGAPEWDFAYSQYKLTPVPSEKSRLLSAMGCASDIWILNRYLELALDPEEIRRQDAISTITYVSRNSIGRLLVWDFFVSKWDVLLESYGGSSFSFSRVIGAVTNSFNTEAELAKLEKFMADHPYQGSGTRAFQQAVEKTKSNIDWMRKNFDVITNWLNQRGFR